MVIEELLRRNSDRLDLDIQVGDGITARQIIMDENLASDLPEKRNKKDIPVDRSRLFYYVSIRDEDEFCEAFNALETPQNYSNGNLTLYQECWIQDLAKAAKLMIDKLGYIKPRLLKAIKEEKPNLMGLFAKIENLDLIPEKIYAFYLKQAIRKKQMEILKLLIKSRDGSLNLKGDDNKHPIYWAAVTQNYEAMKFLMDEKCELNSGHDSAAAQLSSEDLWKYLNSKISYKEKNIIEIDCDFLSKSNGEIDLQKIITISETKSLHRVLDHAIIDTIVSIKWHKIRTMFFMNLALFASFFLCFNTYNLLGYRYYNEKNITEINSYTLSKDTIIDVRITSIVLLFTLLFKEIFEIMLLKWNYLKNYENYIELLLITGAIFTTFFDCSQEFDDSSHLSTTCPAVSATSTLLSGVALILILGKHPNFALKMEMLHVVTISFLSVMYYYSILVISFAMCFYVLFRKYKKKSVFLSPFSGIFKTAVMLTGELDTGDLPFDTLVGISHVLFLAFVFFIVIVLLNLINGLAVDDTRMIKENAKSYVSVSRIQLINLYERVLKRLKLEKCLSRFTKIVGPKLYLNTTTRGITNCYKFNKEDYYYHNFGDQINDDNEVDEDTIESPLISDKEERDNRIMTLHFKIINKYIECQKDIVMHD